MKALLHDIADQMHHCAALMSDPHTMRNRSETVANQITLTAKRIEQLKVYLQRPADLPSDKHWFDKSIVEGVDYLVYKTMERQLRPLYRNFKFPCVFSSLRIVSKKCRTLEDSEDDVIGESLTIREIKETNAMGAFVLLFYSLYWHIALIAINRNKNPGWSRGSEGEDEEVDFNADLWSRLPSWNNLFEYRRFETILAACAPNEEGTHDAIHTAIGDHNVFQDAMIDLDILLDTHAPKQRNSNAMKVLMEVFRASNEMETDEGITGDINSSIHACLGDCIRSRLDWFGHVISTFEMQDPISKWDDMCRRFVVQSDSENAHERCKCKYEYCLLEVLTHDPYNPIDSDITLQIKQALRKFAVYDYGSVSLMMDISKTLIPLARFARKAAVEGEEDIDYIAVLCANVCMHNTEPIESALSRYTPTCGVLKTPSSEFHTTKFIDQTLSPFRSRIRIGDLLEKRSYRLMIDDLAGLYWGSTPCDMFAFNHSYLACPSYEKKLSSLSELTKALQFLCVSDSFHSYSEFVHAVLVRLHRNSMFVSQIAESLLRFLSVYAKTQANASATHDIRSSCCLPSLLGDMQVAQHTFHIRDVNVAESVEALRAYDAGPGGAGPGQIKPKISTLKALLKGELDALQSRILLLSSKPFNKYPGISWPLDFGADHSENNLEFFNVIGKMPVVTRTSRESLSSMADFSDFMLDKFEDASKAEEMAKSASAALRRTQGRGGIGTDGDTAGTGSRRFPGTWVRDLPPPTAELSAEERRERERSAAEERIRLDQTRGTSRAAAAARADAGADTASIEST
jgi:hypothetical protein